jgi:hypothetical protein
MLKLNNCYEKRKAVCYFSLVCMMYSIYEEFGSSRVVTHALSAALSPFERRDDISDRKKKKKKFFFFFLFFFFFFFFFFSRGCVLDHATGNEETVNKKSGPSWPESLNCSKFVSRKLTESPLGKKTKKRKEDPKMSEDDLWEDSSDDDRHNLDLDGDDFDLDDIDNFMVGLESNSLGAFFLSSHARNNVFIFCWFGEPPRPEAFFLDISFIHSLNAISMLQME